MVEAEAEVVEGWGGGLWLEKGGCDSWLLLLWLLLQILGILWAHEAKLKNRINPLDPPAATYVPDLWC